MSEEQVREGYSIMLVGPHGDKIWQRSLGGSSFDDHDSMFYLGEEIVEALPEEAFEPHDEGETAEPHEGERPEESTVQKADRFDNERNYPDDPNDVGLPQF